MCENGGQDDDGEEVVLSDPFNPQQCPEAEEEEAEVDWGDEVDEAAEFQPVLALQAKPKFMKHAHECLGHRNEFA